MSQQHQLSSRNWLSKASAGLVLGFSLALGLCGAFVSFGPGETGFSATGQFTMWLMAPLWASILSFCFLFRNGVRAWCWLGGLNLIVWALLVGNAHFFG